MLDTCVEIQSEISQVFSKLQVIEVELQKTKEELDKANSQEKSCSESLAKAKEELGSALKGDVIRLDTYLKLDKRIEILHRYHVEAKALKNAYEGAIKTINKAKKTLEGTQATLLLKLEKASRNVISLHGLKDAARNSETNDREYI